MFRRICRRGGLTVAPTRDLPGLVRRRRGIGLARLIVLTGILAALLPVSTAQAARAVHFSFTAPAVFTDTTTCGFPIDVNLQADVVGTAFFDSSSTVGRYGESGFGPA